MKVALGFFVHGKTSCFLSENWTPPALNGHLRKDVNLQIIPLWQKMYVLQITNLHFGGVFAYIYICIIPYHPHHSSIIEFPSVAAKVHTTPLPVKYQTMHPSPPHQTEFGGEFRDPGPHDPNKRLPPSDAGLKFIAINLAKKKLCKIMAQNPLSLCLFVPAYLSCLPPETPPGFRRFR